MNFGFTTIQHEPRLELGLKMNEYCLADMIYHLSVNPSAPVPGWCSMSKQNMADFLGITKRSVIRMLNDLESADLIQKSHKGFLVKSSQKWVDIVVNYNPRKRGSVNVTTGEKMSPPLVKKCHQVGEKMSPLYIYNNNNTDKDSVQGSEIIFEIKKENPIIHQTLVQYGQFHERVIKQLLENNIKADFQKDLMPIIHHWMKTNWVAGNLNRPTNLVQRDCGSFIQAVMKKGGLKKPANGSESSEAIPEFKPSHLPYNNPHED